MSRTPEGPIEADPIDFYCGRDIATEVSPLLDEVLAGVELGAYDRRLVEWAKGAWDQPTMITIASWILRARQAGEAGQGRRAVITTTTAHLRDLLDQIEAWEPHPGSTATEAYTILRNAADFQALADDLVRSAVADVRSIPAQGRKIVPDPRPGADSRSVVEQKVSAADRASSRWSWKAIGHVLGVTSQAAQQRFGARPRS
jgi:hypothetical protein